ncbi:MAG: hypothetical protein IJG65_01810 [Synergistaceae bacterium]|nr:hypothetical protein [Synergistaceae bacterium]
MTFPKDFASNKRWDFAVNTSGHVYAIETNFYTDKGSKLNEPARSYRLISEHARNIDGFTFIWITDGKGWTSARNNLQDTKKSSPAITQGRNLFLPSYCTPDLLR